MRITLDRLEAFVVACEAGSFSAAARRLGKSQSTLSAAIAQLEVDVGADLFDRSTRVPRLTEAGRRLALEARTVVDRARGFERHADALALEQAPSLTLAAGVHMRLLSEPLRDFAEHYPYVNLMVHSPVGMRIDEQVRRGEAALGVGFAAPGYDRSLDFRQLGKLILLHVVHRDHPLAARERVGFADLREHRRLVHSDQADVQPTTEYLQAAQTWEVFGYEPLVELTRAGLGWATVPRQCVLEELARGEFVELQLEAYPHTDWLVGVDLVYPRSRLPSRPELWLRERLSAHLVSERDRDGNPTAPR
ncbi:LysR family transcriptional regulator [Nocardiopsis potens]|uniref:LysR family transcriptional regulator n=1 Tax=Nocardiopsis potens TaxID=1246458 RepID=UPI00034DBA7F|nr:LysR family transcriptional regulator [Nocardiopsis potens]